MDYKGISPEEILRQKEINGGLVYDDPPQQKKELKDPFDPEPRAESTTSPDPEQNRPDSLGKSQRVSQFKPIETGWKNLPVNLTPSRGDYYPEGCRIAIRPAEVKEIRFFSTIDEDDQLNIEEKLSYILDKCCRVEFPEDGIVDYRDIKQEDRFFIIMAIRDLTFVKGENSIILTPHKKCNNKDCTFKDGIELRTGVLSSYEIDPKISQYYNPQTRSFVFNIKKIEKSLELFIPSIGINEQISEFIRECTKRGVEPDGPFLQIAPFLFPDWRNLTFDVIFNKMRESDYWTKEEFSLLFEISQRIKIGTKLEVKIKCPVCGDGEVAAEIAFPGGLRSLFVISDIFGELL